MNARTILSKNFILVAAGQIISLFGNQILRYALPLYLLTQTGSSALFGTISAISFIPMLLLYPIGGIIADRVNKRNIMVILDFAAALLIFLFCMLSGKLDIIPLMAGTMILLYGIQGAYQPAVKASVPALVDAEHMMQANSVVDLIHSVASMAGPVIGGILFSLIGLTPILYISIGCFFASAVMELFIHIPFEKKQADCNILVTGINDLKESFHFMFQVQPALYKISLIFASLNLFLGSLVLIGTPVIITQYLDFAPDTANRLYGYAQGMMAAGSILGGLLAGMLAGKFKLKTSSFLLMGCALSMLPGGLALHISADSNIAYLALVTGCSVMTALSTLIQIQVMTYMQMLTPNALIGKVISCVLCVCMCTNPLGQFIYGMIFDAVGSNVYLPFYGAALAMLFISFLSRPLFSGLDKRRNIVFEKNEYHSSASR